MFVDNSSSILIRGLDRWSQLWDEALSRIDVKERKSLGLAPFSTEFALLFRRIIEVSNTKEGPMPKYLQRSVTFDTESLHHFIQQQFIE